MSDTRSAGRATASGAARAPAARPHRAALIALIIALVGCAAAAPQSATAAPAGEGSRSENAGPTYVSQQWSAYVPAGGSLDVEAVVPVIAATSGAAHSVVSEQPGELIVEATSPAGQRHTAAAAWDPAVGATVSATFGPDGGDGVWHVRLTATTATGEPWPQAWAPYMPVDEWSIAPRDASGIARPGRVWTETYYQAESGMTARGVTRWDQTHWLLSDTGVVYRVTQLGFNGFNSRMTVDDIGLSDSACTGPIYRSASMGEPGVRLGFQCPQVRLFRIFFEEPDASMPATAAFPDGTASWVMPDYVAPALPELSFSQTVPGAGWGGDVLVTLTGQAGTVEVHIDVDGDGHFDGDRDVRLSQVAPLGTSAIAWDGLDAHGDPVPLSQPVSVRAELARFGEIHFTQSDVEYREGGIEVEALTGPQVGSRALWWDDSTLPGCHRDNISNGLAECTGEVPPLTGDGVDSTGGVHRWGRDAASITWTETTWGDGKYIDEWTFHSDHAVSEMVRLVGGVEVTKTADADTVTAGDTTEHTWTVTNTGDVDLVDLKVIDDLAGVLPAGHVAPESIAATTGDTLLDLEAATLTWTGDLAVGDGATVTYELVVDAAAEVTRITDTVAVVGWDAAASVQQDITALPSPLPSPSAQVIATGPPPAPSGLAVTGMTGVVAVLATAATLLAAGAAGVGRSRRRAAGRQLVDELGESR